MTRSLLRGPRWQDEGDDPDYRFSLANERTFLAWIRTALALLAASVAATQVSSARESQVTQALLAGALAVNGLVLALLAYPRWARNERSMRLGLPLSSTPALLITAVLVSGVGAGAVLIVVATGR